MFVYILFHMKGWGNKCTMSVLVKQWRLELKLELSHPWQASLKKDPSIMCIDKALHVRIFRWMPKGIYQMRTAQLKMRKAVPAPFYVFRNKLHCAELWSMQFMEGFCFCGCCCILKSPVAASHEEESINEMVHTEGSLTANIWPRHFPLIQQFQFNFERPRMRGRKLLVSTPGGIAWGLNIACRMVCGFEVEGAFRRFVRVMSSQIAFE